MSDGLRLEEARILRAGQPLIAADITVAPGEVAAVTGPSGSGKSTLLSWITGHLEPPFSASGRIRVDDIDVTDLPPHERGVGILFQDDVLFAHLSVGGNLAFGLRSGGSRSERRARIDDALQEIGLAGFAGRDPATLSGGQKARVALMRMLLAEPKAILLDEAFSGLDGDLRPRMRRLVFDLAAARRLPVLMVSHDADDAAAATGPIIRLGQTPPPAPA